MWSLAPPSLPFWYDAARMQDLDDENAAGGGHSPGGSQQSAADPPSAHSGSQAGAQQPPQEPGTPYSQRSAVAGTPSQRSSAAPFSQLRSPLSYRSSVGGTPSNIQTPASRIAWPMGHQGNDCSLRARVHDDVNFDSAMVAHRLITPPVCICGQARAR